MAEAIRYALSRRDRVTCFFDDGLIERGFNTVERAIRPITLNRKNALCVGVDRGGEH
ncbi:MAG: transposase [Candidatus Methanoperedens sp.]